MKNQGIALRIREFRDDLLCNSDKFRRVSTKLYVVWMNAKRMWRNRGKEKTV